MKSITSNMLNAAIAVSVVQPIKSVSRNPNLVKMRSVNSRVFFYGCASSNAVTPRAAVNITHLGTILMPDTTFPRNASNVMRKIR